MNDFSMCKSLAESFAILASYETPTDPVEVSADHEVIYAGPAPSVVSDEHRGRLHELGWIVNKGFDCWQRFV